MGSPSSALKRPYEIRERTFEFACVVVAFCGELGRSDWIRRYIAGQLLKSGTSIGANMEEAKAPSSRKDFAAKTGVALRESRETGYWLRLIIACRLSPTADADVLLTEAGELTAILTTMVKKTRAKKKR